jgi:hypothetical protein
MTPFYHVPVMYALYADVYPEARVDNITGSTVVVKDVSVFSRPHKAIYIVKLGCECTADVDALRRAIITNRTELAAAACVSAGVDGSLYTVDEGVEWAHSTLAVLKTEEEARAVAIRAFTAILARLAPFPITNLTIVN